jgi:ATP-dependent helicase/nuclease subunit A
VARKHPAPCCGAVGAERRVFVNQEQRTPHDGPGDIRVIAAGAGTGKTHRLTDELLSALTPSSEGRAPLVTPESVVAVTYTKSAAAELAARVRRALIERGHVDLARRLHHARIGTVHSVCTQFIEEHAFALGLSPELVVLDERAADAAFVAALRAELRPPELLQLEALTAHFGERFFERLCLQVAAMARSNGIEPAALSESLRASQESLGDSLPTPQSAASIDDALHEALKSALARPPPASAPPAVLERHHRAQQAAALLARGVTPAWSDWLSLERDAPSAAVARAARAHVAHPTLRAELFGVLELVFAVTARASTLFREQKRARGVVDFTDMEELTLALVQQEDVAQALRSDVQLLLVDEFQDTSPLQLSLFRALAGLARRTVVVGDEKQSIFGFRHAEPALFRALDAEANARSILDRSYRSRPGLVRAVSAVFAPAFWALGGLNEASVVLQAADTFEPAALGPCVERWWTDGRWPTVAARPGDENVAAAGVAELLSTRSVVIRGRPTPEGEPTLTVARAKDIAVLCRTNASARRVAAALAERGVPAMLRRGGLSETWEARLLEAALRLWDTPQDLLARASLVRFWSDPRGERCLSEPWVHGSEHLLGTFDDDENVRAVLVARTREPTAGLVRAFDSIVGALGLRDRCVQWGDAAQRLADLAALRALAVRFVERAVAEGHGPSIESFVSRLEQLRAGSEDDDDDERGDVSGSDAVTIMTWHKAKGREWPVVVLTDLWKGPWARVFDVVVESPVSLVDPARPLFGRRLRLWPCPYESGSQGGLFDVLKNTRPVQRATRQAREEALRLLYVGMTRARDRIVVVGDHTVWDRGIFSVLADERGSFCREPTRGTQASWGPRGRSVEVSCEVLFPAPDARVSSSKTDVVLPRCGAGPKPVFAPMFLQPSSSAGEGRAGSRRVLGPAIPWEPTTEIRTDLNRLGQAVHAFLAVDAFLPATDVAKRTQLAERIHARFAVGASWSSEQFLVVGDRLWGMLSTVWPGHRRRTEVPVLHQTSAGSIVRGQIDLLLDGLVPSGPPPFGDVPSASRDAQIDRDCGSGWAMIVDHKTTPDGDVSAYAGQLRAYQEAVEKTGLVVVGTYIHLPLRGELVEVLGEPRA